MEHKGVGSAGWTSGVQSLMNDEFEKANRIHWVEQTLLSIRTSLEPITTGKIRRGRRCKAKRDWLEPGMRKTTVKDSQDIARNLVERINKWCDELDEKA